MPSFRTSLGLLGLALLVNLAFADVCWMLYQLADNDLEYFIRQDNYELSTSSVIRTPSLTTWVYFDSRNFLGTNDDIDEPLRNVFQSDGSTVTGLKTTLSQYLRWDHTLGKMVIDRTLPNEQDGDNPGTMTEFFVTAMQDCVSKGSTEFFVTLASHGGGFNGFGEDENPGRRRLTAQSNPSIVSAMRSALDQISGSDSKFDMIGFDSCLMQAVGAADDYRAVGHYLLASEALEPGHGWAYDLLTDGSSTMGLAREIYSTFLESKHGQSIHMTPKTLSIVDLAKYSVFLNSWNELSAELRRLVAAQDPEVYKELNRARNSVVAFKSVVDDVGTNRPSAVDVGSFLNIFGNSCRPSSGSTLGALITNAQAAYNGMFVERGVGEGTPEGTGMHIIWPVRREYAMYKTFYDEHLFDTSLPYATADAPDWLALLKDFYETPAPPTGGTSVCTLGVETVVEPEPGQMLIGPELSKIQNGGYWLTTDITREVDEVFVEFGVDFGPLQARGRGLKQLSHPSTTEAATSKETDVRSASRYSTRRPSLPRSRQASDQRLLRGDYFFVFGGNILGSYNQSTFSAFWDRRFYVFEDEGGNYQSFYAFDNGATSKSAHIIYMPPGNPITSETISQTPLGMGEEEFMMAYGGQYGVLSFTSAGVDGIISDGLTLYTKDGSALSETPRSAGGQIIPVQYVEAIVDGVEVNVLVGGISSTVVDWNEAFSIRVVSTEAYLQQQGLDKAVLDIVASDDDVLLQNDSLDGIDFVSFEIFKDGSTKLVTYGGGGSSMSSGSHIGSTRGWHASEMTLIVCSLAGLLIN